MMYLVLVILLLAGNALAAPTISGLIGTVSHGSSIVISGGGFGTKSTQNGAAPIAFSSHENGTVSADIGAWAVNHDTIQDSMAVTTTIPRKTHNNRSLECNYTTWGMCGYEGGADAANWYAQYWFYTGSDFTWGADGNNKIFRMWPSSGLNNLRIQAPWNKVDIVVESIDESRGAYIGGSNPCNAGDLAQTPGWYPVVPGGSCIDALYGRSCGCSWWSYNFTNWSGFDTDITPQAWHLFQFELQASSVDGSDGVLRWWVDGKRVFDRSDMRTRATGNSSYTHPVVVGVAASAGGGVDATGHYYLNDVYIDNSLQRVEIGNNATYDSCTHREIQPATAWSNTSTTITVNQGSFADSSTGYIFVTDAAGTRNTGYSITFGAGAVVNGACGSQSGGSASSLTSGSPNLCATGTVVSFAGTGGWTWGCDGSGGGTSTSSTACSASLAASTAKYTTRGVTCRGCN